MHNTKNEICAIIRKQGKPDMNVNENSSENIELRKRLAEKIAEVYMSGVDEFMSDCEPGFSMWGAEEILKLKKKHGEIIFHAIVPCKGQTEKWKEPFRMRNEQILKQADIVTTLNSQCFRSPAKENYAPNMMSKTCSLLITEEDDGKVFLQQNSVE